MRWRRRCHRIWAILYSAFSIGVIGKLLIDLKELNDWISGQSSSVRRDASQMTHRDVCWDCYTPSFAFGFSSHIKSFVLC